MSQERGGSWGSRLSVLGEKRPVPLGVAGSGARILGSRWRRPRSQGTLQKLPLYPFGINHITSALNFPGGLDGEESVCNTEDLGSIPGLGRFPWRREWLPTLVFLTGEFHGQTSLAGYSPHGHNRTERLTDTFMSWDFPGGPVAKTLCSQCRGPGFDP